MAVIYSRKEHEDIRCLKIFSSNGNSDFCNSFNNMLPKFKFDCSTYKGIFESGAPTTFFTSDPVLITKRGLVDEETAMKLVILFPLMLPDDGFLQHMNKIGAVLEQLYICALGKKACLIGFIMQTVKFLTVDFLLGLVKKVVGAPDSNMPLYIEQSNGSLTILYRMKQNAGIFPEYNSSGRDLIRSAITSFTLSSFIPLKLTHRS
jgi:hypothetical protein